MERKIILAAPRGFCAGVRRALETVERVLSRFQPPIYIFHEIVHNNYIVNDLRSRGVMFVEDMAEVPAGAPLIFSAHGVAPEVEQQATAKGLKIIDATCPLVKKIHYKAEAAKKSKKMIILIGHNGHPETVGTRGQAGDNALVVEAVADVAGLPDLSFGQAAVYLTQTTLSPEDTGDIVAALLKRYPTIQGDGDICYATRNRQRAVKALCGKCDLILVIGSPNSSNSNRLREIAKKHNVPALLIDSARDISAKAISSAWRIGISAGASAPECLVEQTIEYLRGCGWNIVEEVVSIREDVNFSPIEL